MDKKTRKERMEGLGTWGKKINEGGGEENNDKGLSVPQTLMQYISISMII